MIVFYFLTILYNRWKTWIKRIYSLPYIYIYIYIYIYTHNKTLVFYTFRSLKFCVNIHLSWCPLPHLSSVGGKIFFQKELFMRRTFGGNLWEGVALHGGVLIRSCKGRGSFIKAFFNNLNTLNLFPNYVGIFTWRWRPDQNYGMIYRWVNSWERGFKDCVMFSFLHADSELGHWCIIWKVNTRNRMLYLKKKPLLTLPCLAF